MSRPIELRPNAEAAATAWDVGATPLLEHYGDTVRPLLQAVVYSHRAHFPVPVIVTGSARSGIRDLLQALRELTGEWPEVRSDRLTVRTLRLGAERGLPLLAENITSRDRGMLDELHEEYFDYGSPLQEASLVLATSNQRMHRSVASRVLHVPLRPDGPDRVARAEISTVTRSGARRLAQTYLQQRAPRCALPTRARRAIATAGDQELEPGRRRDAALTAADAVLRSLKLPALPVTHDPIVQAVREALRAAVARDDLVVGRLDAGTLYAIPNQITPGIREAAGDPTLTRAAIARALERAELLTTKTTQSRTAPARIHGRLTRVWHIKARILD